MTDSFEFTLDNPLTEEQWDMIADVDFDHTDRIWFHTKHGKEVEFAKVIRCKDCGHWDYCDSGIDGTAHGDCFMLSILTDDMFFCGLAERKEE